MPAATARATSGFPDSAITSVGHTPVAYPRRRRKMLLHLFGEPLPRAHVGQAQAILVHQHRLVLEPCLPRLLGHVLVDALAEFARVGRKIQALRFLSEA